MSELIVMKTEDLIGPALDWAVAQAEGIPVTVVRGSPLSEPGIPWFVATHPGLWAYTPSTDLAGAMGLVEKYGVLLSPPESPIHVNGGPNAGWQQSGAWGSTIFRKGEHRRKAYNSACPMVAACRAVVGYVFGPTVAIPVELTQ